jgi:hypothetical protein
LSRKLVFCIKLLKQIFLSFILLNSYLVKCEFFIALGGLNYALFSFFLIFLFEQNSFGLQSNYVSIRIDCLSAALEQTDLQKCPEMAITMPKDATNSLLKKAVFVPI